MKWWEYFIWFPIAILISLGIWIIPLWIGKIFSDAKKYRKKESDYRKDLLHMAEDKSKLEKKIQYLEDLVDGQEITIGYYRDYTGLREREIGDALKSKNKKENDKKRKKRK